MIKNTILTEDDTNVVIDVILRRVAEDPKLAEEGKVGRSVVFQGILPEHWR